MLIRSPVSIRVSRYSVFRAAIFRKYCSSLRFQPYARYPTNGRYNDDNDNTRSRVTEMQRSLRQTIKANRYSRAPVKFQGNFTPMRQIQSFPPFPSFIAEQRDLLFSRAFDVIDTRVPWIRGFISANRHVSQDETSARLVRNSSRSLSDTSTMRC